MFSKYVVAFKNKTCKWYNKLSYYTKLLGSSFTLYTKLVAMLCLPITDFLILEVISCFMYGVQYTIPCITLLYFSFLYTFCSVRVSLQKMSQNKMMPKGSKHSAVKEFILKMFPFTCL